MTLSYHTETGDFRGPTLIVDADTHAQAVRDWLGASYGGEADNAADYTDDQYAAARAEVDQESHWADLADVEGTGVWSRLAAQDSQESAATTVASAAGRRGKGIEFADFLRCGTANRLVAVSWSTRRYRTWIHAAYQSGLYSTPGRTLCGKSIYECLIDGEGDAAKAAVNCTSCRRILERERAP